MVGCSEPLPEPQPEPAQPGVCEPMEEAIAAQVEALGLEPRADDLIVPYHGVAEVFDLALSLALPEGRGLVLLGEQHLENGTLGLIREVIEGSELVDCLLIERGVDELPALDRFLRTGVCPEENGGPAAICGVRKRARLLASAAAAQRAVYPIDVCTRCGRFEELFGRGAGAPVVTAIELGEVLLAERNAFMAASIYDLFQERRCQLALVQTGRAHLGPPPGWGLGPLPSLQDEVAAYGLPVVAWPIVDVPGEVRGREPGRPGPRRSVRFVRRQGAVTAIFVE